MFTMLIEFPSLEILNIQETSENISKGAILFLSPKICCMEEDTQNTKKQVITRNKMALMRGMHHVPQEWQKCTYVSQTPRPCWLGGLLFATFKWKKVSYEAQTNVETLHINKIPLIHNFSFKMKRFKRKASARSFKGGVYLLTLSL